jgi:hypothetical protein
LGFRIHYSFKQKRGPAPAGETVVVAPVGQVKLDKGRTGIYFPAIQNSYKVTVPFNEISYFTVVLLLNFWF